jgi:cytoskeletal protein CcmA (bactofilin family)
MFKSKKKVDPNSTDTLIGENSVFEGKIRSEASIRIEGQIHGNVESSGDVIVGVHGIVKSNINARNAVLAGEVHGNVTVKDKLTVSSTGKLYGNVAAQSLVIEEGGLFQGSSKMENIQGQGNADSMKTNEAQNKPMDMKSYQAQ